MVQLHRIHNRVKLSNQLAIYSHANSTIYCTSHLKSNQQPFALQPLFKSTTPFQIPPPITCTESRITALLWWMVVRLQPWPMCFHLSLIKGVLFSCSGVWSKEQTHQGICKTPLTLKISTCILEKIKNIIWRKQASVRLKQSQLHEGQHHTQTNSDTAIQRGTEALGETIRGNKICPSVVKEQ